MKIFGGGVVRDNFLALLSLFSLKVTLGTALNIINFVVSYGR